MLLPVVPEWVTRLLKHIITQGRGIVNRLRVAAGQDMMEKH